MRRSRLSDVRRRRCTLAAGINVAVGTTGSAAVPVGTRVTLGATNERDVIWSGACTSGGQKVKTCAFTLNGPASVTATVQ